MTTEPIEPNRALLEALRSGSPQREEEALDQIYASLREAARALAPGGGRRINQQADSVVQSVLSKNLLSAVRRCGDDLHLQNLLRLAVKNKIIDRARKKRPQSLDGGVDGDSADVLHDGRDLGIGSVVVDNDGFKRLEATLLSAVSNDREATLVTMGVLEDPVWEDVASVIGIETNAAKTAMTRLRPRLMGAVVEPLRERLTGVQWAVVQGLLIDRMSMERIVECTGMNDSGVLAVVQGTVNPLLVEIYGGEGAAVIARLLGRVRA